MLSSAKQVFELKSQEVEHYFRFLKSAVSDKSSIHCPSKGSWKSKLLDEETKKILKANSFLILYNLIESSIRTVVSEIFDSIKSNGNSYEQLRYELRKIWVGQNFRTVGQTAHPDKYRELALQLVENAVAKVVLEMDANSLPISGNLDADSIRDLAKMFGFSEKAHPRAKGGAKLETIKEKRNNLAHGLESFAECGRLYSYPDLEMIKNESLIFLRSIIRNADRYLENKKYLN